MVIRGVPGIIVRAAAEQIGFITFARFVMELEVVLCELDLPSGGAGSNFVGLRPVREVLVVGMTLFARFSMIRRIVGNRE
jgi:hypothetical protein